MNVLKYITLLEKLHQLILAQKTGTPTQLAKQLDISRATLYMIIDELNSMDLKIAYSRKQQTFYYQSDKKLSIHFRIEPMSESELNIIIN